MKLEHFERGRSKESPVNLPTYEDILEYSHLPSSAFDVEKYRKYLKSIEKRTNLLWEQKKVFGEQIESLREYYKRGSEIFRKHFNLVEDLLNSFSQSLTSMSEQTDLFPQSENWFLAEDQLDRLSAYARDLKYAVSNLLSIGNYQSISLKESLENQVGPGQLARQELGTIYARYDLSPRQTEAYYDSLVRHSEDVKSTTLIVGSGMAALTASLALAKSEKPEAKYLIGNQLYFENDRFVEHLASEVGIDQIELYNNDNELKEQMEQDPEVIFVEPVSNTPDMVITNLEDIVNIPTKHKERLVLIDYTLSGPNIDFSELTKNLDKNTILLLMSSLQKMHEEGDDITAAGIITVLAKNEEIVNEISKKIRGFRAMLGLNISPYNLTLLQQISPEATRDYAEAIGGNVQEISSYINDLKSSLIEKVVSPPIDKKGNSQAALFFIHFKQNIGSDFIDKLIEGAIDKGLQIVDGSSFGFKNTRATILEKGKVVRFSPGIENPRQLELLKKIIQDVLNELEKK